MSVNRIPNTAPQATHRQCNWWCWACQDTETSTIRCRGIARLKLHQPRYTATATIKLHCNGYVLGMAEIGMPHPGLTKGQAPSTSKAAPSAPSRAAARSSRLPASGIVLAASAATLAQGGSGPRALHPGPPRRLEAAPRASGDATCRHMAAGRHMGLSNLAPATCPHPITQKTPPKRVTQ